MAECSYGGEGSGSCTELQACLNACPAPQQITGDAESCPVDDVITCPNDCFGSASAGSIELFFDVDECVYTLCEAECGPSGSEQTCDQCVESTCASEIAACEGDDPSDEICDDDEDNDGDDLVDCEDPNCSSFPDCDTEGDENCSNLVDDDGDNIPDCADPDCASTAGCLDGELSCQSVSTCRFWW